jgi:two-component system sensor histidine kinase BaeS
MVSVAVITVVVGGVTAAFLVDREVDRSVRAEFRRQAEATAALVDAGLREEPGPGPPGPRAPLRNLGQLLAVVSAVGGHDYVEAAVIGERGTVTVLGDGTGTLIDQVPGGAARVERPVEFEAEMDGASVAAFATPVPLPERGTVLVVFGTDVELVPWGAVAVRMLFAVGLGVLLASVLAGSLSRFLARRLEGLGVAAGRLASGDLTARAPVEGDDEVTGVALAFNDMAEQLEESRRREREFLVSVSHDLRTPLTTISGYAEAIDEGVVRGDELSRVAGVLHRESGRLQRLVEDLMLLSRIEAREFSLRLEEVDLAGHLGGVVEAFRGRAAAADIKLVAELPAVPPAHVDPDRVAQVVGNLLENALRYTPEGGAVRLSLSSDDGWARISVTDSGPGIDEADLPRIFERLYVAQRYRAVRPEGSGLGLSIVRELAAAMGGRTEVESTVGAGTTVTVVLPTVPGAG